MTHYFCLFDYADTSYACTRCGKTDLARAGAESFRVGTAVLADRPALCGRCESEEARRRRAALTTVADVRA